LFINNLRHPAGPVVCLFGIRLADSTGNTCKNVTDLVSLIINRGLFASNDDDVTWYR
jgi:hypothetical protein